VKADCIKFRETNAVSHNHAGFTNSARIRLANITVPAINLNHAFNFIALSPLYVIYFSLYLICLDSAAEKKIHKIFLNLLEFSCVLR
jgi:hypothetical protein